MMLKAPVYRSSRWLAAVRSLECCVLCGRYGVQAAHRNEGKGMARKVDDCLTAALCPDCHREIDNGHGLTREERRQRMDAAIIETIAQLARRGLIRVE
ncbi:hypothetical protein ACJW8B_16650 [Plesiomonas shigelloides]|uniref:hypothetical protein n=1 Tax=Plesiomonas shigelloides TaxID=703 RepID=UPI00387F25CC